MENLNHYQKSIVVLAEHLDDLNHVNNVVYLQWVQDMAKAHWESKNATEINEKYYWVVNDHYLQYKRPAFLNDEIKAITYVEKLEGARSTRIVEFYKNEALLVKATTNWVLINKSTNRPSRITLEITELFFLSGLDGGAQTI